MSLPSPRVGGSTTAPDASFYAEMEGPLIELAQRSNGDLRKLLTVFFGFLHRRTDFYCIPSEVPLSATDSETTNSSNAGTMRRSIGFKEGDAEKLLLAAFRQFPLRRMPPSGQNTEPKTQGRPSVDDTAANAKSKSTENAAPAKSTGTKHKDDGAITLTEEGLQIPMGNGGSTERYKWTQTLEECTVLLPIPDGIRGKELHVDLQPERLLVREKTSRSNTVENAEQPRTFLDGPLVHRIVPSESTWTLESGVLQVVLYKHSKTFWDTILQGDARIDVELVDSRRNIDTYDAATQAQIRKIMFDQQQSAKGLPLSNELLQATSGESAKPTIPPLPAGVEYIDQEILEAKMKELGK